MERETFVIQGQSCYVRFIEYNQGFTNYLVGTFNSRESPVSVRLNGEDSSSLRLRAVSIGLFQIVESTENCQGDY